MPPSSALVQHPACNRHDTGPGHPENRDRLPAMLGAVHADAALSAALVERLGEPCSEEDLLRVHSADHVARMKEAADEARRSQEFVWIDPDTAVGPGSWEAALAAAGCAVTAAEMVMKGESATAFALSRPPGHHATVRQAMGFCLFNNVAVAIRRLQARKLVARVLVVDWDVHHGNGTQEIFAEDPSVYFLSLHLGDHYPGTGAAVERGAGAGFGTTRNVPLPPGTTPSEYCVRYLAALDEALASFAPELVLVSAGFDCLAGDPLGGLLLEPEDLHRLTADLMERTASAQGRVAAVLEGGYVPERIGSGLVNVLRAFAGLPARPDRSEVRRA
jgi:acetoin utilization deacetylase AcuC-like enzyme